MADLALVINDAVTGNIMLPAHSYVVAASSPALGQLLSDRLAERESLEADAKGPVSLDLSSDGLACVQAALKFMYSLCPYQGEHPKIGSAEEAKQLATFGQKYGVTLMSAASDTYLHDLLISSHRLLHSNRLLPHDSRKSYTNSQAEQVKEQLPDILKWALFAEAKGLHKILKFCEQWLAHHFTLYPDAYQQLCCLKDSSMVSILLLLKNRVEV